MPPPRQAGNRDSTKANSRRLRNSPDIEAIRPFFDAEYYLKQCPELARSDACPRAHYLAGGAKEGLNPHPLFDSSFYLERNLDVAQSGANPLLHYIRNGASERRDPHPLFDTSYYLEKNRDVAESGVNPLLHYITYGYAEGRWPNRLFDSAYYRRENPDAAVAGTNPLVHFIERGAQAGRNPHPAFDIHLYLEHHPEASAPGVNPLVHYFEHAGMAKPRAARPAASAALRTNPRPGAFALQALEGAGEPGSRFSPARTVLCVSHVPPYPPRAGNEYLIYRQLDCLERNGYRIVLAVSPLPGEELSPEQLRILSARFPYTILCGRDGLVEHRLPEGRGVLDALDGIVPAPLALEIGEDPASDPSERAVIGYERTLCHDFLARLALHLEAALAPCIVLAEYIFQTRFLPLVRSHSLKIVQTHDMFSAKQRKVIELGVSETLSLTEEQERRRLLRADLILSCQSGETQEFARLAPECLVLDVAVDFDVVDRMPLAAAPKILFVASDNPLNAKGLRDFLRLAWPLILRDVPDAELLVAGRVCRTVRWAPDNVRLLGVADSLDPLYEQACLTINPSVAGTGLKIKTAESLSHLRPAVCWPCGVDGFHPALSALCHVARNWPEFAAKTIAILRSPAQNYFSEAQQRQIRDLLSPATVYGPLLEHLDAYCELQGYPAARVGDGQ